MTKLTRADRSEVDSLCRDTYTYIFQLLDSDWRIGGAEAGRLASKTEKVLRDELTELLAVDE